MAPADLPSVALVAGFPVFLFGAARWRLAYERPPAESLSLVRRDRRRRAWIHTWMVAGVVLTTTGLWGLPFTLVDEAAATLAGMTAALFGCGAAVWLVCLGFRLSVVQWAAERAVADGAVPEVFPPLDRWAVVLYDVHMVTAYLAAAGVGGVLLLAGTVPAWVGWAGLVWGVGGAAGVVATRFAGPFNPPVMAVFYPAVAGGALLLP